MSTTTTSSWPHEGAYRTSDARPPILDEVIALATELVDPSAIYLFGSRARGDFHRTSDIDIGIVPRRTADWGRFATEVRESTQTLLDFDLVNMLECGPELAQRIREEGVLVYADP